MILLDTNVISELMKPVPDAMVERWFLLNEADCRISAVSIGELAYGIARLDESKRKAKLGEQLTGWRLRYGDRTCMFDTAAAMTYGDILAAARRAGRPMSLPDAQIAAIADHQGCRLATRNVRDFEVSGLDLIDPWQG